MTEYIRQRAGRVRSRPALCDECLCLRSGRQHPEFERIAARGDVNLELVSTGELSDEDLFGERILDVLLDRSLERPRSVLLVVAVLDQEVSGRGRELQAELLFRQTAANVLEQHRDDL